MSAANGHNTVNVMVNDMTKKTWVVCVTRTTEYSFLVTPDEDTEQSAMDKYQELPFESLVLHDMQDSGFDSNPWQAYRLEEENL